MGYYIDFMFNIDTFPGVERIGELFLEAGMEEQQPWSKTDKNGVEHHYRDFIGIYGLIALFDHPHGDAIEGKVYCAHSRFSWANSGEMTRTLTDIVELGEKTGFTPYDGTVFVTRKNIADIVADYEKSCAKIAKSLCVTTDEETPLALKKTCDEEKTDKLRQLLKMQVYELELSVSVYTCLKNGGIHTLADLVRNEESDLLKIKEFGAEMLAEIKFPLTNLGLSLGMDVDKIFGNGLDKVADDFS
jgi:hypothetical protein